MKIFFYINNIGYGGAERVIVNLSSIFADNNHDVALITSFRVEKEYELNPKIKRYSLEKEEQKSNFLKRNFSRIKKLKELCKKEKPDVLVSFMGENNFRAILATRGLKTKTIVSVRNDPNKEYPTKLFKFLAKTLYKKADGVVFQTDDAKSWFPKRVQNKSRVIMNQVSDKFFNIKKENEEYYVATGRLNQQKNYPMMIRAFARFVKDNPNEKLFIYGNGDLREDLDELIKNLNVEKNIVLKGSSSDIPSVLKNAKGFLLSSDYEGIPNGLLEAMAVGVPSISTDCPCGGPKMMINHNENGLLIPVGDEYKLYESLSSLENADLRKKISANAKKSAEKFKPEVIYENWEKYLKEVVGENNENLLFSSNIV